MDTEVIYCDDNLRRLALLPSNSVDLVYLDPPFFSNRHYEVIWGDEAEVRSFEDRWEGGVHHYVGWMKERILEIHRVLGQKGSLYLHCDWHAAHYLKQMLDEVFGENKFQNEVVWYYKGAGISPKRWARRHDTIFFYTKGKEWYFDPDPVRDQYAESTKERFSHYIGNIRDGHDFGEQALNPKGKHPDDVWQIKIVAPSAKARLGYPTQKPEALLNRIILASSPKDSVILDPFAGCGTTLVSAQQHGRHWIGIDISPTACNLMKRRLVKVGAQSIKMIGMPTTVKDLKCLKPFEFQNWIVDRINGVQSNKKVGDMGIDGWTWMLHDPIQIKQSESIGREIIDKFESAIQRVTKTKGFIIAFSFTKGSYEEVARVKERGLEIHLIEVKDILDDINSVYNLMGISAGFPELATAPMPEINIKARSADDLIKSQRATT
ncbi:MAG: site-specific DNA-methyltransferase [Candidatus Bathyarchaeota archaeon]|nr:site-specific DNA-methyltransferase [Candidatus Bathyarchaeota archaeon]